MWKPNDEPHEIDPWLNELQRRVYTKEEKDGLLARTKAADPEGKWMGRLT